LHILHYKQLPNAFQLNSINQTKSVNALYLSNMATRVAGGLHKAQEALQNTSSKDKKLVDLERNTCDVHTKQDMTTDHGVGINDTDHWLRAVDDNNTGPSLLEDQIAREKVSCPEYVPYEPLILISIDPSF
jgi:hypothetical protein